MSAVLNAPRFFVGKKLPQVKVSPAMLRDIKMLADFHNKSIQDYVAELLAPTLRSEKVKMANGLAGEISEGDSPQGRGRRHQ